MEPRLEKRGDSRELAVLVHGLGPTRLVNDVKESLTEYLPNADLMVPRFNSGLWSNSNPVDLAESLSDCIRHAEKERPKGYERITLIGHSLGALLVRKAYVFASGQNHEMWRAGLKPQIEPWAAKVSRIILLAGMNRGWSVLPKPEHRSWVKTGAYWTGDLVARLTGTGRLLRSLKRGAPFIANLRIQWINLIRQGKQVPITVQILGDIDDVVSDEDNIDLQSGAHFIYLGVGRTGHEAVVRFGGSTGQQRREVFLRALLTPDSDLKSEYAVPEEQQPRPEVEQVVFIMHGIRDRGDWTERLAGHIRQESAGVDRQIEVITSSYGYFPMGKFLLLGERQKNVRWFMDEYTQALARYPNADMEFVGHSNGTYLLASALAHYRACHFERAVFAGSVVRTDFPWEQMIQQGRITALRNYVATADWVVGIFPHLYEYLPDAFTVADIGGGGFLGFESAAVRKLEARFVRGAHSAAISRENFAAISRFILAGEPEPIPVPLERTKQSFVVSFLSKLCWMVWLLLFAALVSGLIGAVLYPPFARLVPELWARVALYLILVVLVLNTI